MRKLFAFFLLYLRQKLSTRLACFALLALLAASAVTARADERAIKMRVAPVSPELAKRMKISGSVSVQATVDAEGKVTDAKATNGNRLLGGAAEDAVRKWKFVPGDGVSVITVEINFTMQYKLNVFAAINKARPGRALFIWCNSCFHTVAFLVLLARATGAWIVAAYLFARAALTGRAGGRAAGHLRGF